MVEFLDCQAFYIFARQIFREVILLDETLPLERWFM